MVRVFFFWIAASFLSASAIAQGYVPAAAVNPAERSADTGKPYLKHPALPAFNILLQDSATIFNTYNIPRGSVTALVLFDPDCKHCKWSTAALMKAMDSVKDVQFYFVTSLRDMGPVRSFYEEYGMGRHKNIKVVGRDIEFFFIEYYGVMRFPDVALYDENKKLIKLLEGDFTATSIYNAVHER